MTDLGAGSAMFLGTYTPRLDDKGRLILPAKFRSQLAPGLVMTRGQERCLFLLPMDEFRRMSIPGAVDVPGGELVYRIGALAPQPDTTVVVNCAGRTRSIMGAESLRSAGVPNRVVALRNGTMGWELAGLRCARGETASFPAGVPTGAEQARARAGVAVQVPTNRYERP